MKIIISLPLIVLILFSGFSVNFATHYCGGHVAATKVSLTGELATCGMERPTDHNLSQDTYRKHCCEDFISVYSICNIYIPSSYYFREAAQQVINLINVPVAFISNQEKIIITLNENIKPPGPIYPRSATLPTLCVFRI